MKTKPILFEVLNHIPDTRNVEQLVALCLAYGADIEETLAFAAWTNREFDAEERRHHSV